VVALMESLNTKEFGRVFCSGGGSFTLPVDGGGVVGARMDGPFPQVKGMDQHVLLGNGCHQFQVRVGDGAFGVVPRDKGGLDMWGKPFTPQDGGVSGFLRCQGGCAGIM
jgi:hypothetical protein